MMPVMPDVLTSHAAAFGDRLAIVDDRPGALPILWTFADFEKETNRLAHVLRAENVSSGTKVVTLGQNSAGWLRSAHACRKVGATHVPLNYRLTSEEAAYVVDNSDAEVLVVDAEYAELARRIAPDAPRVRAVFVFDGEALEGQRSLDAALLNAPDGPLGDGDAGAAAAASMIYTSGTTGKPKGAVRDTAGSPEQVLGLLQLLGWKSEYVYLTTGPLYHSGPGSFSVIGTTLGNTVVVQHKFDSIDWLRLVDTYRCSATFSAPTPIRMVCNVDQVEFDSFDVSCMQLMIANAAPWSFALKQAYLDRFPKESLFEVYGSTELGVNCVLEPLDQLRKPGSCGRPAPHVEVKLFDDDGAEVTGTGPDAPGELFVRAGSVFTSYYKAADKYEADMRGDFHTVGDIAYRDDEGYLYICDRKKDMIISGGVNIYPAEIESALEQNPDVFDVAVFGVPDEQWGEAVHAVVVAHAGVVPDANKIITWAREHLASYKVPRTITFMDELPRNGSGKLLKRELRAPFWAGHSRMVG